MALCVVGLAPSCACRVYHTLARLLKLGSIISEQLFLTGPDILPWLINDIQVLLKGFPLFIDVNLK